MKFLFFSFILSVSLFSQAHETANIPVYGVLNIFSNRSGADWKFEIGIFEQAKASYELTQLNVARYSADQCARQVVEVVQKWNTSGIQDKALSVALEKYRQQQKTSGVVVSGEDRIFVSANFNHKTEGINGEGDVMGTLVNKLTVFDIMISVKAEGKEWISASADDLSYQTAGADNNELICDGYATPKLLVQTLTENLQQATDAIVRKRQQDAEEALRKKSAAKVKAVEEQDLLLK